VFAARKGGRKADGWRVLFSLVRLDSSPASSLDLRLVTAGWADIGMDSAQAGAPIGLSGTRCA
jgi:hypothetical protein